MSNPDLEIKSLNLRDLQIDLETLLHSEDRNLYQFKVNDKGDRVLDTQQNPLWNIRGRTVADEFIHRYHDSDHYVFANIHDVMIQIDVMQLSHILDNIKGAHVWKIDPTDEVQMMYDIDFDEVCTMRFQHRYQFFIEKSQVREYLPGFGPYHGLLKLREKSE